MQPVDPVALGLCKQGELDAAVAKAVRRTAAEGGVVNDTERLKLVSTEQSLAMEAEPRLPSSMSGLENFRLGTRKEGSPQSAKADAESLFNLAPADSHDDEDE